ncbi:MAG: bifunctional glutamate N-acetyltransferase/amino-acid acetyltransferase ArgJ [Pseudomonadota bacterium]
MKGFKFAGIRAGIKKKDQKDLGLIYCETPCTAAALFTKNKVIAAPVILGREKIQYGTCQAVLVNSGNANCFTGEKGLEDARQCSKLVAAQFNISDSQVIVSSTGVIGAPLPMEKFKTGIPVIAAELSEEKIDDFADAILTTDLCRKKVTRTGQINGHSFEIIGVAKGSGMIRPDMATMLAFICTDVTISSQNLKSALLKANEKSFNRITVDGDTSTNDTVLALANGSSQVLIETEKAFKIFGQVLDDVCLELALKILHDGEGATKLVKIIVTGAQSKEDAYKACDAIAHSNLVKTAIYGEDPNWGRITAAAGRSGACVDPKKMNLFFEGQPLVLNGDWLGNEAEKKIAKIMKNKTISIELNLNLGQYSDYYYFCDFSENYVKINADYRS